MVADDVDGSEAMSADVTSVLVVAYPPDERERLGGWAEGAGYEVLTCPGPRGGAPCVGLLGWCPLAAGADAVVLDVTLEEDPAKDTVPGWQVLSVYIELGIGVVALTDPRDLRLIEWSELVIPVPRAVDRDAFLAAVQEALARGAVGSERRDETGPNLEAG